MRPDAPRGLFLARDGTWFHDGQGLHHERLAALLHRSIARAADGSLVVTTGRDLTVFVAEDAPFLVRALRSEDARLTLSDGSDEVLAGPLFIDADGRVRVRVKGGSFWALLSRAVAQQVMVGLDADGARVHVGAFAFAIDATVHGWST